MPLTFPFNLATFQETLRIASAPPFRLRLNEESSGLGSGQIITAERAPPKWVAEFSLITMEYAEAARVIALLTALGSSNRVWLYDPSIPYPKADPKGLGISTSPLTVSGLGSDGSSLRVSGLPASYVLSAGDMISVGYGLPSRRWLGRLVENATANGSGQTPIFSVMPHLPTGLVVGSTATVRKPFGVFLIADYDPGVASGTKVTGVRFSAIQVPI